MTRTFVVVNPAAGSGRTRRVWPRLREVLHRSGLDFDCEETTGRGSATDLTRLALRAGARMVVAVGGDGTVNEVANGVMSVEAANATVGIIATGRGRDVCQNLGVARDPDTAARRIVDGTEAPIDLGLAEWDDGRRRCFVNVFSAGFDAMVSTDVGNRRNLNRSACQGSPS